MGRPYASRGPGMYPAPAMEIELMGATPPYALPLPGRTCDAGEATDEPAPGAGPAVNGSVAGGGCALAACRLLCRIACLLFWNQICTLLADIPNFLANSTRSSVDGNAVRLYVSLRTFNCSASARMGRGLVW